MTVLYPQTSDATFNMDYYLKSHMPMVFNEMKPHGLKGWTASKVLGSPDGSPAPYSVQVILRFDKPEDVQKALEATGEKVLGDIPNFSNQQPVMFLSSEVGNDQ